MKTVIKLMFLLFASILLSSCEYMKDNLFNDSVESDSVEQTEYNYVPTVYDILQEREELKYSLWCDSVYLNIPEQILTHLLVTKGTTQSIVEIVEDYANNKEFYHNTILKAMDIQKKYIPDSLPKKSTPTKNKDTIPEYEK